MDNGNIWEMKIEFGARNFENLKIISSHILKQIANAKSFKELPISGRSSSGFSPGRFEYSYHVETISPVEAKVAALRAEADAMEKAQVRGDL